MDIAHLQVHFCHPDTLDFPTNYCSALSLQKWKDEYQFFLTLLRLAILKKQSNQLKINLN